MVDVTMPLMIGCAPRTVSELNGARMVPDHHRNERLDRIADRVFGLQPRE
jgi:hypothetical protein